MTTRDSLKRGNAEDWTVARIGELSVQEIKQLLDNAERLVEPALAERCRAALRGARFTHRQLAQRKPNTRTKQVGAEFWAKWGKKAAVRN